MSFPSDSDGVVFIELVHAEYPEMIWPKWNMVHLRWNMVNKNLMDSLVLPALLAFLLHVQGMFFDKFTDKEVYFHVDYAI